MIQKEKFKDLLTYALLIGLFILAFYIIKPIAASIIYGILLGYIFYPIHIWISKKTNKKNISALIICFGVLIIIIGLAVVLLNSLSKQVIDTYFYVQQIDPVNTLRELLPKVITSSEISEAIVGSLSSSVSGLLAEILSNVSMVIVNFPKILLNLFVVFFVFFFSLRDGEETIEYIKSLSPLAKETNEKFSKQFKGVTSSVLIGQVVIGIFQGLIAGMGYFIFGAPNALLLTLLTMLVGVIPVIGPWLVWIPVDVYLFASGNTGAGIGLLIYGLVLVSWIDTLIRPIIVSRRTRINSGIVLIGMIGGLFVFGILGLIIGPLVLAYVLLVMELYRKKTEESIVFIEDKDKK